MVSEGNTSSEGGQPGTGSQAPSPLPFLHYIITFPASHATRNDLVTQFWSDRGPWGGLEKAAGVLIKGTREHTMLPAPPSCLNAEVTIEPHQLWCEGKAPDTPQPPLLGETPVPSCE